MKYVWKWSREVQKRKHLTVSDIFSRRDNQTLLLRMLSLAHTKKKLCLRNRQNRIRIWELDTSVILQPETQQETISFVLSLQGLGLALSELFPTCLQQLFVYSDFSSKPGSYGYIFFSFYLCFYNTLLHTEKVTSCYSFRTDTPLKILALEEERKDKHNTGKKVETEKCIYYNLNYIITIIETFYVQKNPIFFSVTMLGRHQLDFVAKKVQKGKSRKTRHIEILREISVQG